MKYLRKEAIPLMSIFSIPLLNSIYTVLNSNEGKVYNLVTNFDDIIPFVSFFIIPYNLWYPFIISSLIYLCLKDKNIFSKTVISIDLGLIACYIVYLTFQTTVPRPILDGEDIFTKLVGLTYSLDKPYNCFPSIHVLTSYLVMKGYYLANFRNVQIKSAVFCLGGTVIISTLFVKQHIIIDIFGGVILGEIVYFLATFINEERIILWVKKQYSFLRIKLKSEI